MSSSAGMTPTAELEEALLHLLRAKEVAAVFNYPDELIERIDLLTRATARVRLQAVTRQEWQEIT